MEIDLFTFIAQLINFTILVLLLRKFLFGRLMRAIDEREKAIAARIAEADALAAASAADAAASRAARTAFEAETEALRAAALEEIARLKALWSSEARASVDADKSAWLTELGAHKDALALDLRERWTAAVSSSLRKILTDLADTDLEARIALSFVAMMGKTEILADIPLPAQALLRSAFPLDPSTISAVGALLEARYTTAIVLDATIDPAIICGIELLLDDKRIAWHVNEYIDQLNEALSHIPPSSETPS